jgi:CRP-like cAMP-binding protein
MSKPAQPTSLGLRRIALLEGLAPERFDALARECAWRNFAAEQSIISRAAPDRDLYFIVSGRVRVTTYSAAGRQVTFRDFGPGEHFGEVAAIDGLARSADVVGLEGGLLASLPPTALRRLLSEEPALAERLLSDFAKLVRRLSSRVIDLSTLGVHQRLHAELLRLARDGPAVDPGDAHWRHARPQAPAPEAGAARHPAHHARTARLADRDVRRQALLRGPALRRLR